MNITKGFWLMVLGGAFIGFLLVMHIINHRITHEVAEMEEAGLQVVVGQLRDDGVLVAAPRPQPIVIDPHHDPLRPITSMAPEPSPAVDSRQRTSQAPRHELSLDTDVLLQ